MTHEENTEQLQEVRDSNARRIGTLLERTDNTIALPLKADIQGVRLDGIVALLLGQAPDEVKVAFELAFETNVAALLEAHETALNRQVLAL